MNWKNEYDRNAFIDAYQALCELHGKDASKPLAKMYFMALAEFEVEQVMRAIVSHIGTSKWFPKPAEIREAILGPQMPVEAVAEVEAGKVLQAMKEVGSHRSVCFDDAVTMAVIRQGFGGWVQLCTDSRAADEKWFRKDFVRTYVAYAHAGVKLYGGLAGQQAVTNSANGVAHDEQPVMIGDVSKAQKYMVTQNTEILGGVDALLVVPKCNEVAS